MKKILLTNCFLLGVLTLFATAPGTTISGKVTSKDEPVPYVNIGLAGTNLGSASDENGYFKIENVPAGTYVLKVSSIGYAPFSVKVIVEEGMEVVMNIPLSKMDLELDEVVVTGTMKETTISESPVKIEILTSKFFQNNTCHTVMEALDMVNGVEEQVNCGVCGTSCIHINGMEGAYTLMLLDGMPIMSALASTYGFSGIPNALIDRVEIIKGPSSTLYGTEAVGGVINIITKNPKDMQLINLNVSGTTHNEYNLDLAMSPRINKNLTTTISTNMYSNSQRLDDNSDNFTDIPISNRMTIFNKWDLKRKDQRKASIALRYYAEDRFGGTMQWTPEHKGSDSIYGEYIETERYEVIGSYQLPLKENIRIDYSYNRHYQDSWYGDTRYKADQSIYFANLLWNKQSGRHDWVAGLTTRYQTYEDNTPSYTDEREYIPGIFVQDEFSLTKKTSLLGGARLDHHQKHGFIFAPRLNVKHSFSTYTTARINIGTGFREVHLFTEDHAFYAGARKVVIAEGLRPEESYNIALNLNHVYAGFKGAGTIDVDLFYTYFTNKIVPDYDVDPNLIVYDNLGGHGIVKGASFNIHHSFESPLSLNIGGTFLNVYQVNYDEYGNKYNEKQEFAPVFSGTYGVDYESKKAGLTVSLTGKIIGPQKLPVYEHPFERPETSPWYSLSNVQVTKKLKHGFELYTAVKNVFNYTQSSPLVDPEHPFGENFDTAYAYGPLQTRRLLFGMRWNFSPANYE